jgi:hypothetical protein
MSPSFNKLPSTRYRHAESNASRDHFTTRSRHAPRAIPDLSHSLDRTATATSLLGVAAERDILGRPGIQPPKQDFQFIQIHEASGKADTETGSHLRSHLMRKYHENRRRSQNVQPKVRKVSKKKGCTHFEVIFMPQQHLSVPDFVSEIPSVFENLDKDTESSPAFPSISELANSYRTPNIENRCPSRSQDPDIELTSSRRVICCQCGKLMLKYSSNDEKTELQPFQEDPRSLLTSNSQDPFDSLAISVSHGMHSMIHDCKTSNTIVIGLSLI